MLAFFFLLALVSSEDMEETNVRSLQACPSYRALEVLVSGDDVFKALILELTRHFIILYNF